MVERGIESGLLKRVLTDSATGLPNRLYLDLIREWEERQSRRQESETVCVLNLTVSGGTPERRRHLVLELLGTLRQSDLIASEGEERLYVLVTLHRATEAAAVRERVRRAVAAANAAYQPTDALELEFAVADD